MGYDMSIVLYVCRFYVWENDWDRGVAISDLSNSAYHIIDKINSGKMGDMEKVAYMSLIVYRRIGMIMTMVMARWKESVLSCHNFFPSSLRSKVLYVVVIIRELLLKYNLHQVLYYCFLIFKINTKKYKKGMLLAMMVLDTTCKIEVVVWSPCKPFYP